VRLWVGRSWVGRGCGWLNRGKSGVGQGAGRGRGWLRLWERGIGSGGGGVKGRWGWRGGLGSGWD